MKFLTGNPIFLREFRSTARAPRTRIIVTLYLFALCALLYMLWPRGGVQSAVTADSLRIFSIFFGADLALLMLMVPAFTSGAISLERENGTYNALFSTLLTPFQIMTGKLGAAILMLLAVCLLSLPAAAMCALTGGVDTLFMLKTTLLLFVTAVSYGVAGLAASSCCERTSTAVMLSYTLILVFAGATWLPSALLANLLPGELAGVWQTLRSFSPFDALMYLIYPNDYAASMVVSSYGKIFTPFTIYIGFSCLMTVAAFIVFCRNIVRPRFSGRSRRSGNVYSDADKSVMRKRKLTFPFYLLDPLKRKKPIGRFRNPVFVAEMRDRLFSNPEFIIRAVSGIFIISIVLMILVSLQFAEYVKGDMVRLYSIIFQLGVVSLLAPAVASGLITDEISSGTFTALRMTRITPLKLILGKLEATFFYALIFILSGVFVFVVMTYLKLQDVDNNLAFFMPEFWQGLGENYADPVWRAQFFDTYESLAAWIAVLFMTTLAMLCAGLFSSSIAKNTSTATAFSYGFAAVICVVTLLPLPLADDMTHGTAMCILSFNPFAAAIQSANGAFADFPNLWINNFFALGCLILLFLSASVARVWYLFRNMNP